MSLAPLLVAADPDPFNLQLLEEACRTVGFEVATAIDGIQALDLIARQPPAIAVVAQALEGVSGFELLDILARDQLLDQFPVVLAVENDDARERAESLGAVAMRRPYQVVELQRILRKALRAARDRRRRIREEEMQSSSDLDMATGAGSRAQLLLTLDYELTRAERFRWSMSTLVVAVIGAGPEPDRRALSATAIGLRRNLRAVDQLFRSGPQELTVLLPETDLSGAQVAEGRLRERVRDASFWQGPAPAGVQLHIGIAAWSPRLRERGALLSAARATLRPVARA